MGLSQEHSARAEMVAANLRRSKRLRHPHIGVADDGQIDLEWFQGAERAFRDDLEILPGSRRCKEVLRRSRLVAAGKTVDLLDAYQARPVRPGHCCPSLRSGRSEERRVG